LAECINHPGKEGIYKCARCKKHFCLACVELIDDKAYCYDCLKEIVKEVREETRKSLTLRILMASLLALLVAIVSLHDSYLLLEYIPVYIYKNTVGPREPFNNELLSDAPSLVIGLAFFALSAGLATTKGWSYRYGIVVCVISFVVELMRAMNLPGGIEFFKNNPTSNTSLFYAIMIIGPLMVLIAVAGSRRELTGW
jgi:predicted nucleic acid-binding Zn ribbon protein